MEKISGIAVRCLEREDPNATKPQSLIYLRPWIDRHVPDLSPYAIAFVLSNETFEKDGRIVSLYENKATGECSNFGISLKFLQRIQPSATVADIEALTERQAINLYRTWFFDLSNLGLIEDPPIAARCLDLNVNMGVPWGVRMLQAALNLPTDGILGPSTQNACNATNPALLYGAIVRAATTRYQALHDAQVSQYGQRAADANLAQWIQRLHKMPPPYANTEVQGRQSG